ncbi:MAG: DEAD/DEAH box helicase [Piscinibacter sp.]|uniref:DEAD/DEAH box helicase n=1 Tax=Piscinibacter sp. TaxID=1903157 RepID=UPI00258A2B45|nr:DEAD/DEAH box helicase [Piscinibacter sp.]MCW5667860.1 DEAD/DEAH box helicase [Piscinibacter sp.]
MISLEEFTSAVHDVLGRELNDPQLTCVSHGIESALMIVAGPGSGKTTVLVLRALRHVLVDSMAPESVMITTFTRKAAGELSSRLLGWGITLVDHFSDMARRANDQAKLNWLSRLDINAIQAGTLDSFCQQWLGKTRVIGSPTPVMLEEFAANFVFRRKVFAPAYREGAQATMDPYLAQYNFEGQTPRNQADAGDLSIGINNRLIQDLVDFDGYRDSGAAQRAQAALLQQYREYLQQRQMFDFSLCSERILQSLRSGRLYEQLTPLSALLVDEYQDTNPMQEAIYFELVRQSGCAFAIVGDDDQALYRFRGATVELFTNFQSRFGQQLPGAQSEMVYLSTNHRSTPEIVQFFNAFATHDPAFVAARVAGKPPIREYNPGRDIPILGLFRDSLDDLSADLSQFLLDVFQGEGRRIPGTGALLRGQEQGGALGDAVLLASSVREYKDSNNGPVERLPVQVRQHLETAGLGVFNPRGQDLRDILNVQRLLGLVLLCLDPTDQQEATLYLNRDAQRYVPQWRQAAIDFIATNPAPTSRRASLRHYVDGWRARRTSSGEAWPNEIPLLDLLYKLIVWMPAFQRDPEHLVYLEAIMRCVVQGAHYSGYGFAILNTAPHDSRSRTSVFYDLLSPIAMKEIEVDEDLLFAVPRNRLGIMTIHQSKGLEYPLVIVDVGSEFKSNHAKQAFRRFPRESSPTVLMESGMAPFTGVGNLRTARRDIDRTFDDLMRLYYVAFSRPQVALMLVGLTKNIEYATSVQNVATFWRRDGTWSWRTNNPAMKRGAPPMPELMPLELI